MTIHEHHPRNHGPTSFWTKYVFSTDHKVIGIQFTFASLVFVILGGLLALAVRYQLAWPSQNAPYHALLPGAPGTAAAMVSPETPEANLGLWQHGGPMVLTRAITVVEDAGKWRVSGPLSPGERAGVRAGPANENGGNQQAEQPNAHAVSSGLSQSQAPSPQPSPSEGRGSKTIPAGTLASFAGFADDRLAVILPKGTQVRPEYGSTYVLDRELPATVNARDVLGDYGYDQHRVRAEPGTKVHIDGASQAATLELLGTRRYQPDPATGAPRANAVVDTSSQLLLGQRPAQTTAKLKNLHVKLTDPAQAQNLAADQAKIDTALARLGKIKEHNVKVRAEATALEERAVVAQSKGADEQAAYDLRVKAKWTLQALQPEHVTVPLFSNIIAEFPADALRYNKNLLRPEAYLTLFTMHATIMVFFVLMPMLLGGFGNFLIPLMIGARDMAFPKLNMLSYWLAIPASVIIIISFWVPGGASGGGWTMYPPLSGGTYNPTLGPTLWVVAIFLVGFSTIVGTLNYITTIVNMRAPGMTMFRMPLTVWALFITAILALFATPMLAASAILLLLDRTIGTHFFTPAAGGQPLLWQHMFWFFGHPEVYILILPAMGITSDILSTFSRKPIFGYRPMVFAMAAIGFLGFIVWGHHMFQSGMNPVMGTSFMAATIMIAVPSAIKTFNWLGTLWGGDIRFTPAMLNAIGFVSMFVIGGLSGIFMAAAPVDIHIHDTYFIVAHIHYVLFGGTIFGIFAGIYYWFPKMFGRQMNQRWGTIHFIMTIVAFNGTFFLMHILGVGGHPRRYASILEIPTMAHLQPMNVAMTMFAMMMGAAQLPFFYNLFISLPPKLCRAMLMVFPIALGLPIVIGLAFWGGFNGEGQLGVVSWLSHGLWGHTVDGTFANWQVWLGYGLLLATLAGLLVSWLAKLPTGGKIGAFCVMVPLIVLTVMSLSRYGSGYVTLAPVGVESGRGGHAFWQTTHYALVAVGLSMIFVAAVVGVVWAIAAVASAARLSKLTNALMYVVFLPAFLAPLLLKKDAYLWLGVPQWAPATWTAALVVLGVAALPGLVYLLIFRPRDEYGYATVANPWHANTLEWATDSPPPLENFATIPTVYRGPYEYASPASEEDYLPQPHELPAGAVEPAGH
ncbi:MAG: cbb3-type cytochrome c oxidase subunit I [Phycisphaeraceae bacterium]